MAGRARSGGGLSPAGHVLAAQAAQGAYFGLIRDYMYIRNAAAKDLRDTASVLVRAYGRDIVGHAALSYMGQYAELINTFDAAIRDEVSAEAQSRMRQIYEEIASEGNKAVITAYKKSLKHKGLVYRGGDPANFKRYTGGILEAALSESLFQVTANGIEYVSTPLLDAAAPQWYRLNFGAGGRGRKEPREGFIRLFDARIPGPTLAGNPQSKGFNMPAGFWSSEMMDTTDSFMSTMPHPPGDAFYPIIGGRKNSSKSDTRARMEGVVSHFQSGRRATKGIYGTGFLDEGIRVINLRMGPALEYMFRDWAARAGGEVSKKNFASNPTGPLAGLVDVPTATRLSTQAWTHLAGSEKMIVKAKNDSNVAFQRRLDRRFGNFLGLAKPSVFLRPGI